MQLPDNPHPNVDYLDWVKRGSALTWNLACSGVQAVEWRELGLDAGALQLTGDNPYGYPPLIERIAGRYGTHADNVAVALGASQANFLVMASLLKAGDRVLFESPCYEPLYRVAMFLGAQPDFFARRFEDGYGVDPGRVAAALTPRTRLVVLTNLHNPSGARVDDETLRAVGEIAATAGSCGAMVLVDEAYLDFAPDPRPAFRLGERFITTNSLTKVYGLPGLRCGWVMGAPELIARVRALSNYIHLQAPLMAEMAACRAFDRLEWLVERTQKIVAANRPLMDAFMSRYARLIEWVAPPAGSISFPRLTQASARDLAELLRERYDTSIVAGERFGTPQGVTPGECGQHARISFGNHTDIVREGLRRIGLALEEMASVSDAA